MAKILKYTVPVDDQWHTIEGVSTPLKVGSQKSNEVQFWAWPRDNVAAYEYRVYGTGHEVPDDAAYVGTTTDAGGFFVWHLVRRAV